MKACGVIVEYNPFHNGHLYHIKTARKKSQADVVIAVMSGNFLQRGEPAVVDKWQRADAALAHGVDLVIELPIQYACQAADIFAKGGIKTLAALQCDSLCFGTDYDATFDYNAFGQQLNRQSAEIKALFQRKADQKKTYPQIMQEVYQELFNLPQVNQMLPNHILGLSYAKENAQLQNPMNLIAIKRQKAGYHDIQITDGKIASATAIRKLLQEDGDISNFVPTKTKQSVEKYSVDWHNFWPYLRYRLMSSSLEDLLILYQMESGLALKMQQTALNTTDFTDFLSQVKSKHYTLTRIQRQLCYILLNITRAEMQLAWSDNYLRILGFNRKGQKYLNQLKKVIPWPLLAKIGKSGANQVPLTLRADEIYRLASKDISEQNFGRRPLKLN